MSKKYKINTRNFSQNRLTVFPYPFENLPTPEQQKRIDREALGKIERQKEISREVEKILRDRTQIDEQLKREKERWVKVQKKEEKKGIKGN